jgi:PEP-CTERM motif-containing protein
MTHTTHLQRLSAASLLAIAATSGAQAANVTLFGDRTAYLTALGAAPLVTQDFESFADGSNLVGVDILPGMTASTNLANLNVFKGSGDQEMFATSRDLPEAEYQLNMNAPYTSMGFDIDGFNPGTPGPGFLDFYFADGDTTYQGIPVLPLNATESDPLFQGIISDTAITKIVWREGPEIGGINCCEETALDNFVAVQAVPEPSALFMVLGGLGLVGLPAVRRRIGLMR